MSQLQEPLKLKTFSKEIGDLNKLLIKIKVERSPHTKNVILDSEGLIKFLTEILDKLNTYEETPTIKYTTPQPLDNNHY